MKTTPILTLITLAAAVAVLLSPSPVAAAGGSSLPTPPPSAPQKSLAEQAIDHYNKALELRDEAWALEKAGDSPETAKKTDKLYKKAIKELKQAVDKNGQFYQAYSSLGYALRKTGDYDAALEAYNTSLSLAPTYAEAIEYRAETFLALNRIPEAKTSYITLFSRDRARADQLMDAMLAWVEQRKTDPAGADPQEVRALGDWLKERQEMASQTASLSRLPEQRW